MGMSGPHMTPYCSFLALNAPGRVTGIPHIHKAQRKPPLTAGNRQPAVLKKCLYLGWLAGGCPRNVSGHALATVFNSYICATTNR